MHTLQIVEVGEPLTSVEVPDPEPGPGQVVIAVRAAGICRSDVHYRSGTRPPPGLPLIPGHEVAGIVEAVGAGVEDARVGDRVCLHYLVTCGSCEACHRGAEQFCVSGQMLGLDRPGGYAERILVPARNAFVVPDSVPLQVAAVMMCSTSTAYHALQRGRLAVGDTVAVFGAGGLGMSAIRLAFLLGAFEVFAVDVNPVKLAAATTGGAIPVNGAEGDAVEQIRDFTGGRGVDVALELVGSPEVMRQAVASLAGSGRAVAVGITNSTFGLDPFNDLVRREAEILGSADHLASEIVILLEMARRGSLQLDEVVSNTVPLEEGPVNAALDRLEAFSDDIRTVILP